jgi:cholesterol transport system auxiliary component
MFFKTGWLVLIASLSVAGLSGCALTSKADALSVRYFTPEQTKPRITSAPSDGAAPRNGIALELGRVSSGVHLRDKIAYRDAAFEVGYYEDKRWTERPEIFVRRELSRTLYEEHGLRRALAGQAPILEVEVVAFEEVRLPTLAARIQLRIIVHDDRTTILEKTITVDRPLPAGSSGIDGLVQAMAQALDAAAEEVATETKTAVRNVATATPTPEAVPPPASR